MPQTLARIVMFLCKHESLTASISTLVNFQLLCRLRNMFVSRLEALSIIDNGTSTAKATIFIAS